MGQWIVAKLFDNCLFSSMRHSHKMAEWEIRFLRCGFLTYGCYFVTTLLVVTFSKGFIRLIVSSSERYRTCLDVMRSPLKNPDLFHRFPCTEKSSIVFQRTGAGDEENSVVQRTTSVARQSRCFKNVPCWRGAVHGTSLNDLQDLDLEYLELKTKSTYLKIHDVFVGSTSSFSNRASEQSFLWGLLGVAVSVQTTT